MQEWLLSADYILSGGNRQVMLCERGIRTFETATRNTFDINAIPLMKGLTHLPILGDPSHGTGKWDLVAAVGAGVHRGGRRRPDDRGASRPGQGALRRRTIAQTGTLCRAGRIDPPDRAGGGTDGVVVEGSRSQVQVTSSAEKRVDTR